jgi:outer membrane protein insertion porin family
MKYILTSLFVTFFLAISSLSAQTIQKIVVEGNERLSNEAVLQYLSSKKGQEINRIQMRDDLKSLYNTGLFKDLRIDVEEIDGGVKVIVVVEEKDYIQKVRFKGNDEVGKGDLEKALDTKLPFLWDESLIKTSVDKIRKLYREKGFYLVNVRTEIETEDRTKILVFEIDEGQKVAIKKIYFQGNSVFSDGALKNVMISKEGGFWGFLSGSGRFDEDILSQVDSRRIQLHYWKYGYAFAKVDAPSITFTPDRKAVIISFHIEEGEQYHVGNLTFSGDLDFVPNPEEHAKKLKSQKGQNWNYLHVQEDITRLQDRYGNEGYAYTNVSPSWEINQDDPNALDIDYRIDKGSIVYFGNIEVHGNYETLDRIIRRELDFTEGELFNITKYRKSQRKLQRLGYFADVKFIQNDILAEQRMDIVIEVEEQRTGSLQLGASFSSFDSFGVQGAVSKINLFGRGYDINLSLLMSSKRQLLNILLMFVHLIRSFSLLMKQRLKSVEEALQLAIL